MLKIRLSLYRRAQCISKFLRTSSARRTQISTYQSSGSSSSSTVTGAVRGGFSVDLDIAPTCRFSRSGSGSQERVSSNRNSDLEVFASPQEKIYRTFDRARMSGTSTPDFTGKKVNVLVYSGTSFITVAFMTMKRFEVLCIGV